MTILALIPKETYSGERLRSVLENGQDQTYLETFDTIETFLSRTHQYLEPGSIGVLLAKSDDDLTELAVVADRLNSLTLLLVIPSTEKHIVSLAHKLRPRYLTSFDDDFRELSNVLNHLVNRNN